MRPADLALVPIYLGSPTSLLDRLAAGLARITGRSSVQCPPWFDPEDAYDPSRGQYLSTRLLALLDDGSGVRFERVLAVTSVDLFVPVLTYVFGEAQLGGRSAVVSLQRLRPEAYGLPRDDGRVAERLLKEAVHELGHCDGLLHCHDPNCVMHASTYVEDIDLKPATPCPVCAGAGGTASPSLRR